MKLDDFVAVSGIPGVFKMAANRSNGLIVEDLDTGKKRFVSARKHQFTPLASIGIYTDDDTTELKYIFQNMLDELAATPPPSTNAPTAEITEYFGKVLPAFDRDRVYISDIKKVIKWFNFLQQRDMLNIPEEEESSADTPVEENKE